MSVVEAPSQIVAAVFVAATVGEGFTVINCVAVPTHPFPSVPVTVYVVVVAGASVIEVPVKLPGIQVYVDAPFAVMVVKLPSQIVPFVVDAETTGNEFTVTVSVAVFVHPGPVEPVTVYVVVAVGFTVIEVPDKFPGIHVYVAAPEPVSVVLLPIQIEGLAAVAVTTGGAPTITVTVAVPEHPFVVPVTV